jgi:zinc transport system substrate-binding protein
MQRRWIIAVLAALTVVAVVFIISARRVEEPTSRKPLVVVTLFPYYDFARIIAGPDADVRLLFPFGVGPHEATMTPEAAGLLARAQLVIMNTEELEPLWSKFKENIAPTVVVVEAARGIDILGRDPKTGTGGDPHVWLSIFNAEIAVRNITDALTELDMAHAAQFTQAAQRLREQLAALDSTFMNAFQFVPNKNIVTFHRAFEYLAKRYGLTVAAVFEEFPGKEPSARELINIIAAIQKADATAIFTEPQFSPRIVNAIAGDLKLPVHELDPIETAQASDSYIGLMKKNLDVLQKALPFDEQLIPGV